jgi:hypothetical protein
LPQSEVFKIDKLRGPGVGTGDAAWKLDARAAVDAKYIELAKDERIRELHGQVSHLRAHASCQPVKAEASPPNYPLRCSLMPHDPPVPALLPLRCGSPGTFGVKRQLAQFERQHAQALKAEGKPWAPPSVGSKGIPQGFHEPPARTVCSSHRALSLTRPAAHHDVAPSRDHRGFPEFVPNWRPPAVQTKVHTMRDLA